MLEAALRAEVAAYVDRSRRPSRRERSKAHGAQRVTQGTSGADRRRCGAGESAPGQRPPCRCRLRDAAAVLLGDPARLGTNITTGQRGVAAVVSAWALDRRFRVRVGAVPRLWGEALAGTAELRDYLQYCGFHGRSRTEWIGAASPTAGEAADDAAVSEPTPFVRADGGPSGSGDATLFAATLGADGTRRHRLSEPRHFPPRSQPNRLRKTRGTSPLRFSGGSSRPHPARSRRRRRVRPPDISPPTLASPRSHTDPAARSVASTPARSSNHKLKRTLSLSAFASLHAPASRAYYSRNATKARGTTPPSSARHAAAATSSTPRSKPNSLTEIHTPPQRPVPEPNPPDRRAPRSPPALPIVDSRCNGTVSTFDGSVLTT